MRYVQIILICLLLSGCSIWRENSNIETSKETTKQEIKVTSDTARIKGIVTIPAIGTIPIDVTISQRGKEETKSKEEAKEDTTGVKESSSPAAEVGGGWLKELLVLLLGGGGVGYAVKMIKDGTISRMVAGIEEFRKTAPAETVTHLEGHLGRKMDGADKKLVKKLKDKG